METALLRPTISHLVTSMFHRPLLPFLSAAGLVVCAISFQLLRLTVVQGAAYRREAEKVLNARSFLPTARGRIFDRRMRTLARDVPTYEIAIDYSVLSGRWARLQAERAASRATPRWSELDDVTRRSLIERYREPFDEQIQRMWQAIAAITNTTEQDLELRRSSIIHRVNTVAASVTAARQSRAEATRAEPVYRGDVEIPVLEETLDHAVIDDVSGEAMVELQAMIDAGSQGDTATNAQAVWRHVSVRPAKKRVLPLETMTVMVDRSTFPGPLRSDEPAEVTVTGVGMHIVGAIRPVYREDVEPRPFHRSTQGGQEVIDLYGYRSGDKTGSFGIERSQEKRLRGRRGMVIRNLETNAVTETPPIAGQDVVLSVDIQLQARIAALMDPALGLMQVQPWHSSEEDAPIGRPLYGAAVVLDVAQGQVLAAVSTPSMDLRAMREDAQAYYEDRDNLIHQPWLNRAVAAMYPPGSTVKPMVLTAAITDRRLGLHEAIGCQGHLYPDRPDRFRCWIFNMFDTTHDIVAGHPLQGDEAIARSCNIFFYTLGQRLGARDVTKWYERFGLGRTHQSGLPEEIPGSVPPLSQAGNPNAAVFSRDNGILMAIGQGPVAWTPLQAAGVYAALERGGHYVSPTFLLNPEPPFAQAHHDLGLNPRAVDLAMRGLRDATQEIYGTGHHLSRLDRELIFNIDGVEVAGKSGTADPGDLRWVDFNRNNKVDPGERMKAPNDHAWFVGLVTRDGSRQPDYVVVVVVDYGGSGGTVAGVVANQVMHAMRAEGYL